MISRVNGVNFTGFYWNYLCNGKKWTQASSRIYMEIVHGVFAFHPTGKHQRNYLEKLHTSIKFWRTRGGCLSEETIQQLLELKIPIEVRNQTNYKTNKKPVIIGVSGRYPNSELQRNTYL